MNMELGDVRCVYTTLRLKDYPFVLRRLTAANIETIPQLLAVTDWNELFPEHRFRWVREELQAIQQRERGSTPSTPSVYSCSNPYVIGRE